MDVPALLQKAYQDFWELTEKRVVAPPCPYTSYDYSVDIPDLVYGLMEKEFTQELINDINQLSGSLHRLSIWEQVIQKYTEDEQLDIRHEFTKHILKNSLLLPYEFRSRLIIFLCPA